MIISKSGKRYFNLPSYDFFADMHENALDRLEILWPPGRSPRIRLLDAVITRVRTSPWKEALLVLMAQPDTSWLDQIEAELRAAEATCVSKTTGV